MLELTENANRFAPKLWDRAAIHCVPTEGGISDGAKSVWSRFSERFDHFDHLEPLNTLTRSVDELQMRFKLWIVSTDFLQQYQWEYQLLVSARSFLGHSHMSDHLACPVMKNFSSYDSQSES